MLQNAETRAVNHSKQMTHRPLNTGQYAHLSRLVYNDLLSAWSPEPITLCYTATHEIFTPLHRPSKCFMDAPHTSSAGRLEDLTAAALQPQESQLKIYFS